MNNEMTVANMQPIQSITRATLAPLTQGRYEAACVNYFETRKLLAETRRDVRTLRRQGKTRIAASFEREADGIKKVLADIRKSIVSLSRRRA